MDRAALGTQPDSRLDQLAQKLLWLCLLVLTIALIRWPVVLSPEDPLPVQSTTAIQNLPWFIGLFSAWTVVLGVLALFIRGGTFERLALCLIFTLVFVQFWAFASPWGNSWDATFFMGNIQFLQLEGEIPPNGFETFRYFDFPGLLLLGAALSDITGLGIISAAHVYVLSSGVILTLIVYVAFLKMMGSPSDAALAVILAIASSMVLGIVANQFHPINMATIFIATFFLILARGEGLLDLRVKIVMIVLALAATTEYMFTPVFFSMVILGGYALQQTGRLPRFASLTMAVIPLTVFLSWELYWTDWNFSDTVGQLPRILRDFQDGQWLNPAERVLGGNLGPRYPWWGSVTRMVWWILVFGFGTILVLWRGILAREYGRRHMELAMLVGILATVAIGAAGSVGLVHGGISRYVWVAPLVLAPAIVETLRRRGARVIAIPIALVVLLLLLPTFFTNSDTVSAQRMYRSELAAGELIRSLHGTGDDLDLYGFPSTPAAAYFYVPRASFEGGADLYAVGKAEAWDTLQNVVEDFEGSTQGAGIMFAVSKGKLTYEERLGIPPDHPNWSSLEEDISAAIRLYDSGGVQLYVPY